MSLEHALVNKIELSIKQDNSCGIFRGIIENVGQPCFNRAEFVDAIRASVLVKDFFTTFSLWWLKNLHVQKCNADFDASNKFSCLIGSDYYESIKNEVAKHCVGQLNDVESAYWKCDFAFRHIPIESAVIDRLKKEDRASQQKLSFCVFAWLHSMESDKEILNGIPEKLKEVFDLKFL